MVNIFRIIKRSQEEAIGRGVTVKEIKAIFSLYISFLTDDDGTSNKAIELRKVKYFFLPLFANVMCNYHISFFVYVQ